MSDQTQHLDPNPVPPSAPRRLGPSAAWEAGDDLCPPWWPRRRVRWSLLGGELPLDLLAADRIYVALTLSAQSLAWSDPALARDARALAWGHVRTAAPVLARGARLRWDGDICPAWPWRRPWPWPPAPDWLDRFGPGLADSPQESNPMPGRASVLLDLLGVLQAYNVAARIADDAVRGALTSAIGGQLVALVDAKANAEG